ncbi:hypothetical protein OKZ62_001738 [Vibrio navarrensis]|nr:hypothetical protein [Vibrio navarrensis]
MNTYLVNVAINTGTHEFKNTLLVRAVCYQVATHFAIYVESNGSTSLNWSDDVVFDESTGFSYVAASSKVKTDEIGVLSKALRLHQSDLSSLLGSGNYRECRYIEPVQVPRTIKEMCLAHITGMIVKGFQNGDYANYLFIKNACSEQLPKGFFMQSDPESPLYFFQFNSRIQLLEYIERKASDLESFINEIMFLTDSQVKKEFGLNKAVSLQEIYQKALFAQLGLTYPDDAEF